jgi:hypothetical protein
VVRLTLGNDGHKAVTFTLTPNDFAGHQRIVPVPGGHSRTADWPADAGTGSYCRRWVSWPVILAMRSKSLSTWRTVSRAASAAAAISD